VDKKYGDVPTHDKDAYVGKKHGDKDKLKDDDRHVGGAGHLPYPAAHTTAHTAVEPRHVGVGDKEVIVDNHHPAGLKDVKHVGDKHRDLGAEKPLSPKHKLADDQLTDVKHVGDKYHSDKGKDLGQNLGQGYDDGAGQKFKEKPLSPKHDKHKKHGLFGKKHDHDDSSSSSSDDDADKQKLGADGQKRTHLFGGKKRDADGRKHKKKRGLFGKKHDHDKPKVEHVVAVDPTPDMNKVRDGDVVSHGEKVKDKYELTEVDHIGDKYISKKGWDLGQNLGKRYDDEDSYKLKDEGRHLVPDNEKKVVEIVRPGETVTTAPTVRDAPLAAPFADAPVGAPLVAIPAAGVTRDEGLSVPSAHGERVYSHEHKDGVRHIGDKPQLHREEGGILSDEHRLDKASGVHAATEPVAEEPHKKGVIGKVIEKVKEKLGASKTVDTTPDPAADKGQHWEKVPDERTADGGHWKDRAVVEGDRHKSKETY
jgi:hypothetical protein